mmetsp:Transcript_42628/g.106646  ORF Transcript_42628/g.106646 Transcript_42628/m.106646 type:complete len:1080 (-) Transcript_42628:350-3589(-)|eukprot:CAMPEP_0173435730 /NCGR_PEP_ID=MMETSP1357-20121228/15557_1 /TAXON_ID=77926 /ORGANISM="Hemiselmis rufescens, Strain PCC563" /LENGTH=1079 /DNA_ID=CAMNT_0014400749 /DNA_START=122 /DNA_END=3361 /DNA_ORIENTATION=+
MSRNVPKNQTVVLCGMNYEIEQSDVEKALKSLKVIPRLLDASGITPKKADKSDDCENDKKRYLVFLNCNSADGARELCKVLDMKPNKELGLERYGNILQAVLKKDISSMGWDDLISSEAKQVEGSISRIIKRECFIDKPIPVKIDKDVFEGSDADWKRLGVGCVLRVLAVKDNNAWSAREAVLVSHAPNKQAAEKDRKLMEARIKEDAENKVLQDAEEKVAGVLVRNMKGKGWTSLGTIGGWFNSPPEPPEVKEALSIIKTKHKQLKNFVAACPAVAVREADGKFEIMLAEELERESMKLSKGQLAKQQEENWKAKASVKDIELTTEDETSEEREGRARSYRVQRALIELVPKIFGEVLRAAWEKNTGQAWAGQKSGGELQKQLKDVKEVQKRLGKHGIDKISSGNMEKWDITLFALLLLDNPGLLQKRDKDAKDAVRSLRTLRNSFVHELHSSPSLSKDDFEGWWSQVTGPLITLCGFTGKPAAKQMFDAEVATILKQGINVKKEATYAAEMNRVLEDMRLVKDTVDELGDVVGNMQQRMVTQSVMGRKVAEEVAKALQGVLPVQQAQQGAAVDDKSGHKVKLSNGKEYAFRYEDTLGNGAQGQVYKARCISDASGSLIALKLMPLSESKVQKREFENLTKLKSNRNIVKVLGEGQLPEKKMMALGMELINGISYDAYLKERGGKIPWQEAKNDFLHIIRGMKAVHEVSVVHRDLKPANIMRKRANGCCVIVDFGLSKDKQKVMGTQTATGAFKGTRAYCAPELLWTKKDEASASDPSIDVFSMGIILYESVSGFLPWGTDDIMSEASTERASLTNVSFADEGTYINYAFNTKKNDPSPLKVEEAPASINKFVLRCLAKGVAEGRFPSAREMLEPWEAAVEAASEEHVFWESCFADRKEVPSSELAKGFEDKFSLTPKVAQRLLEDMDKNDDGGICFQEFEDFFSACAIADKVSEYKDKVEAEEKEASNGIYIDKKLEVHNVAFQSRGTMFGGSKDRRGFLQMHKGKVVAYRYDGNQTIAVYFFEMTIADVGGLSAASLTLNPDNERGKPRNFTFPSAEDMQSFATAFTKTKTSLLEK